LIGDCGHLATGFQESLFLHGFLLQFAAARFLIEYIY